ncbi:MAG: tetratricopeptide repeat protein [Dokdonella sp.]|uniref:tetratricopeptide repeat protein n=1 Tax=Dokdonella sp. TaxID=2291710 RepID=UPI003262E1AB
MHFAILVSDLLESSKNIHRAGRVADAEVGYRNCLRAGEHEAGRPLGALLLGQSRFSEALDVLEPLAERSPDDADLLVNLSVALRRCNRLDDAMEVARRACASAPSNVAAFNARGLAALELERLDDALAAFEAGLLVAPGQPALLVHRARCLQRMTRTSEALQAFAGITSDHPQQLESWRGLAACQAALGDPASALVSRERALRIAPDDPDVLLEYAIALMFAGEPAAAAAQLEQRLAANPEDAQGWQWLGRSRLMLGELPAARVAIGKARQRDADDPVIAHFHAALTGSFPAAVEDDYIRRLFDDFADRFDRTLVEHLSYAVPMRLAKFLRDHDADRGESVLDLGCGTGLLAEHLAREGRFIDGVDLSPRMLEYARAKGRYTHLHASELVSFLCDAATSWELIVAADVFIYVADLRPVYDAVIARLAAGGCFGFSVEASLSQTTELPPATGRYRHPVHGAFSELAAAGFVGIASESVILRMESGQPVMGELILARRPRD